VAYEPHWAIGEGKVAAPAGVIAEVHLGIRAWLTGRGFWPDRARVVYGGSVDPSVAHDLLAQPGVDGLFIGRAGLDPHQFASIARTALPIPA
jgi:triosephosphate isomerase